MGSQFKTETDLDVIVAWCSITAPFFALLGCIVTFTLLIHSSKKYYDITHQTMASSQDPSHRQKNVYLLLISYFTCSLITCIVYTFIRNNTFILQSFTIFQCAFGFYLGYLIFGISKMLMYTTFIYRLQMVFHASPFQYSSRCYKILLSWTYILPSIGLIVYLVANVTTQNQWVLHYNQYTSQVWCFTDGKAHESLIVRGILGLFALSEWIGSCILLGMFIKGLRALQRLVIQQSVGIKDQSYTFSKKQSESKVEQAETTSMDDTEKGKDIEIVVNKHKDKGKGVTSITNNQDLRFIIDLHELMKRQTILISIAVVTSLCFWGLSLTNWGYSMQLGCDFVINVICVWMTLKSSRRYYDCCSKYGFCVLCYLKKM